MRHLKPAERAVLEKVAIGMTDAEIARARGTSYWTARTQVETARVLLGFHTRSDLISWAWRSGWMTATPDWALGRTP